MHDAMDTEEAATQGIELRPMKRHRDCEGIEVNNVSGPARHDTSYRAYVEEAARHHLERLIVFGVRGFSIKSRDGDTVRVQLSEEDASDQALQAFMEFMDAIERRVPTVMTLVQDFDPDSDNTYRMLRWIFTTNTIDDYRKQKRMTTEVDFSSADRRDEGGHAILDRLISKNTAKEYHAPPTQDFEWSNDLRVIVEKAIENNSLNPTRMQILQLHLQGRDDSQIADEMDLTAIQVQKHLWKIRNALKRVFRTLERDE